MTLRETFPYDAPAGTVYAMVTDPEFQTRVMEATLALEHEVEVSPTGEDSHTVTTRRVLPTDQAPETIRRMIGASVRVTQVTQWSPIAADGSRTGRTTLDIAGVPVSGTGEIRLVPTITGTDQIVTADVTCSIPLVGGKIAAAATPLITSALKAEHRTGAAWLGEHRS